MGEKLPAKDFLQGGYFHATLRTLQCPNTRITPANIMYPVFVVDNPDAQEEIPSLPGVYRFGINKLISHLESLVAKGLSSVLIFGVSNLPKNDIASNADSSSNPVITLLPVLRSKFPDLLLACDVCLCPYSAHGHCGILNSDGSINNKESTKRIAQVALAYAKAGAHIVAPSDMMDGRIGAIKAALTNANLENKVSVLSYAAKFASCFYGPFRDAAKSAPSFGNRKSYQLPPGSSGLAKRAVARDVEEGADMLMVKPGLPYLDIVKTTKETFPEYPLFVYQVSGEYAMLHAAAKAGALDLESSIEEVLTSFRRAGTDCVITYFAPLILQMIIEGKI